MLKKYSLISRIFLAASVLLSSATFVSAINLEVPLPGFPSNGTLIDYMSYIINFIIGLAGLVAFIGLLVGGFQYLTAAGNSGKMTDAKSRILKAVLGLAILLSSVLIVKTINPQLIKESPPEKTAIPNVWLTDNKSVTDPTKEKTPAPTRTNDTATLESKWKKIWYECPTGSSASKLLIWWYPEKNFKGVNNAFVTELSCASSMTAASTVAISQGKSYYLDLETPGVYFFREAGCPANGYRSSVSGVGSDNLDDTLKQNVQCIKFVFDKNKPGEWYQIAFSEFNDLNGRCKIYDHKWDGTGNPEHTYNIPTSVPKPSSYYFFLRHPNPTKAGDKVVFYSDPFFFGGYFEIKNTEFPTGSAYFDSNIKTFTWPPEATQEDKDACNPATFKNCPGAVKVIGNYVVIIMEKKANSSEPAFCEIFDSDYTNFKLSYLLQEGRETGSVYIIPVNKSQ